MACFYDPDSERTFCLHTQACVYIYIYIFFFLSQIGVDRKSEFPGNVLKKVGGRAKSRTGKERERERETERERDVQLLYPGPLLG